MAGPWLYVNGEDDADWQGYDDYVAMGMAFDDRASIDDMGSDVDERDLWPQTYRIPELGGLLRTDFRVEFPGQVIVVPSPDHMRIHLPVFTGRDLDHFDPDYCTTEGGSELEYMMGIDLDDGPDFSSESEWSDLTDEEDDDPNHRVSPGPEPGSSSIAAISDWSPGLGWHLRSRMLPADYVLPLPYWG